MIALGTLLFLVLGLAGVLAFSAVMKWRDPQGSLTAVTAFRVPPRFAPAVAVGLPFAELALAFGLLVLPSILFAIVAWLTVVLFAVFTVVVSAALARGEQPDCHCFGELSAEPIGQGTVVRNLVLTIVALVVALSFGDIRWQGLLGVLATLGGDSLFQVIVLTTSSVIMALLWIRVKRTDLRVVDAEKRLAELRHRMLALENGVVDTEAANEPAVRIPSVALTARDGELVDARELVAERAQFVVFVSAGCLPCREAIRRAPDWRSRLGGVVDVLVVAVGQDSEQWDDPQIDLYDPEKRLSTALGSVATPSAVLLGTNGLLGGGPAGGVDEIEDFVAGLLDAIDYNHARNTPMPSAGGDAGAAGSAGAATGAYGDAASAGSAYSDAGDGVGVGSGSGTGTGSSTFDDGDSGTAGESGEFTALATAIDAQRTASEAPSAGRESSAGTRIPSSTVIGADGVEVRLVDAVVALGPGRRALVFWRTDCEYSQSILPEVARSSAEGRTVLVTSSDPAEVREQGIPGPVFLSADRDAMTALAVPGTPVGFLVADDAVVEGPFIGADAVRELLHQVAPR